MPNQENFESQEPQAEISDTEQEREIENRESEELVMEGAEILESPADGSFLHGLQVFIAWVNQLIKGKKDK